jgi:hypothetical protein
MQVFVCTLVLGMAHGWHGHDGDADQMRAQNASSPPC